MKRTCLEALRKARLPKNVSTLRALTPEAIAVVNIVYEGENEASVAPEKMSKNRKMLIFGGFIAVVAAAFYPICFHPMAHKVEYRQVQKINRAGINQADLQPVGLKKWSDPFKPANKG